MPARTIRSSAHRQILTWLRHGPSTVSEIALQFDMRMPHASLACRQLRTLGLIVRDDTGGLRNAPIFLSQAGVERLRQDGLAKLRQHVNQFKSKEQHCVLQADATNVLIGYVENPTSPLLFVPHAVASTDLASSGNRGGVWVLLALESMEWYNLDDFSPALPPTVPQGVTLQDFGQRPSKVGLVRGEVFEATSSGGLVEGQKFSSRGTETSTAPLRLQEGDHPMGTVVGTSHAYFPPTGLVAHLPSPFDRALLLDALSLHAIQLTDRQGLRHRTLPSDVLYDWLAAKHTRMSFEKLSALHTELVTTLTNDASSLAPSLRRELASDFGTVTWLHEPLGPGVLDTYGMSQRGVEALLTHLIKTTEHPFTVDWPFDETGESLQLLAVQHPLCRAWLSRKGSLDATSASIMVQATPQMAVVHVQVGKNTTLPIQLGEEKRFAIEAVGQLTVPASAIELLANIAGTSHARFSLPSPKGDEGRRMTEALELYPKGDEATANVWEATDALASWIATPPQHRPARWVRIHQRLPNGWVELMPVKDAPLTHIAEAVANANPTWQLHAFQRLRVQLVTSPALLLKLVELLAHPHVGAWAATCLLCGLDPASNDHREAFELATERWFGSPKREETVLQTVFGHAPSGREMNQGFLANWLGHARLQPKTSLLQLWAECLDGLHANEPWLSERQRLAMQVFPPEWWACFANDWLTAQLSSASGRVWLQDHPLPWLVQVTLPEGWSCGLPGALRPHPGFTLRSETLLSVKLLSEGQGVSMLNDVYEAVYAMEQHLPPPALHCHPYGGWLVHPVETWPSFGESVLSEGNEHVGQLLFARSFARRLQA
jgi:hypothetical protein